MTTDERLLTTALAQLADSSEVTPPPVPQLLMRGKRARNRRRLGWSTAAGITVAGTLTVAVLAATAAGSPPSAPFADQKSSPTAAQGSPSAAEPSEQDKFQLVKSTAARLSDVVDEALKAAATGARWTDAYFPESSTGKGQPPTVAIKSNGGPSQQRMYSIDGSIIYDGRRGQFEVAVEMEASESCGSAEQGKDNCASPNYSQEAQKEREAMLSCQEKVESRTRCVETSGPHGERMVTMSYTLSAPNGAMPRCWDWVYVLLADGRVLRASNSNYYPDPVNKSVRAQAEPPLTDQQLVKIAIDVSAHIKP